jgi:stage II sporulation protein AA (anti-sigma F factor antagonist)
MDTKEQQVAEATFLAISGRLDSETAREFEVTLTATLSRGVRALALDLSGLEYVSSAGLRIFLMAAKRTKAESLPFALFGLQPQVAKVLEVSGFAKVLPIAGDRQDALAALGAK